jgi:hypothetical protein
MRKQRKQRTQTIMAKTLYHSELTGMGPVQVKVTGNITKSKYQGKPDFIGLDFGGTERTYNIENPSCGDVFHNRKGQLITIQATGSRDEAMIELISEDGAAPAPKSRPATNTPPARPTTPAASGGAATQATAADPVGSLRKFLARRGNGWALCRIVAEHKGRQIADATGHPVPEEAVQAATASLYISADRAGLLDDFPTSDISDLLKK